MSDFKGFGKPPVPKKNDFGIDLARLVEINPDTGEEFIKVPGFPVIKCYRDENDNLLLDAEDVASAIKVDVMNIHDFVRDRPDLNPRY